MRTHNKGGSFTGATRDKKGLFEMADGGWIVLDEVARLSPKAQASLLRTLETGDIRPVGSNNSKKVKVQVIAATNEDLESMVGQNLFRRDLLERLTSHEIYLRPLRERTKSEVEEIVDFLVCRLNSSDYPGGNPNVEYRLENEVKKLLVNARWQKGNVRQMWNTLTSASIEACNDGLIALAYLPKSFLDSFCHSENETNGANWYRKLNSYSNGAATDKAPPITEENGPLRFTNREVAADYNEINKRIKKMENTDINLPDTLALFEKFLLKRSLTIHKSYTRAAKALEIPKTSFCNKKSKYSIDRLLLN